MFSEFWSVLEEVTGKELAAKEEIEKRFATAKGKIIEVLGGLIYEEAIEIEPESEKIDEIKYALLDRFPSDLVDTLRNFLDSLSFEELRTGKLCDSKFGFQSGTKLGKVFLSFAKENSIPEKSGLDLEKLNSLFSNFLQSIREDKFVFRLSVHPLDFLLISENTTGWSSCHALDGSHRAGNLAYLLDAVTIVGYVYKDCDKFMGINWPRKIWRQLIFVDVDNAVAFFQRQYPNRNDTFAETIRKIMEKLLAKYHNVENPKWLLLKNPIGDIEICSRLPYVDQPESRIRLEGISQTPQPIKVGARVPCPNCGSNYVLDPKFFLCDDCGDNDAVKCRSCGAILHPDDALWYDDEPYCETCFYENFDFCQHCGEAFPMDQILRGPNGYLYCETCFDEMFAQCDNCGEYLHRDDLWEGPDHRYYCETCFDSLFSLCDICEEYRENADMIEYCGLHICRECFRKTFIVDVSQCDNCGCTVENEELIELDDGRKLCANCAHRLGIRIMGVLA